MTDRDTIPELDPGEDTESPEVDTHGPPPPEDAPRFLVRDWKGHAAYLCTSCPFSTLKRTELDAHLRTHHPTTA